MEKKGEILIENVIFIVLNLIYLTILILFVMSRGAGVAGLEESYSKQIALIIDSSKPDTYFYINIEDAIEVAKKKWGEDNLDKIVKVSGNMVTVKLTEKSGQSYSFFNTVRIGKIQVREKGVYINVLAKE